MWIWNYSRDLTEVSGGVDAAGEPVNLVLTASFLLLLQFPLYMKDYFVHRRWQPFICTVEKSHRSFPGFQSLRWWFSD